MKMWRKVIMDFLLTSHLDKSVKVTRSKVSYIPPALKTLNCLIDIFETMNKEMIWTTIVSTAESNREFTPSTVVTSISNGRELIPSTIATPLSNGKELIPTAIVSVLTSSPEVGGV